MNTLFLRKILRPEVNYNISTRLFQAFGGLVSIILISEFLSQIDQGFYYTIQSLAASYILFELGLSNTLVNFFSNSNNKAANKVNLNSINKFDLFSGSLLMYFFISIVAFFVLFFLGFLFLLSESRQDLLMVWLIISASISVNLNLLPHIVFIESNGFVIDVNKMRFYQAITSLLVLWIALVLGFQIFSLAFYFFCISICQLVFLLTRKNHLILLRKLSYSYKNLKHLLKAVFTTQAKVSLTWIFGYFTAAGLVPIVMKIHGPEIAGKFGMALQISTLCMMIAYALISTRVPYWGHTIAKNKFTTFRNDFLFRQKMALFLYVTIILSVLLVIAILRNYDLNFVDRILAPRELFLLFFNGFITLAVLIDAAFVRIHKTEIHHYQAISYTSSVLLAWWIFSLYSLNFHLYLLILCNLTLGLAMSKFLKYKFLNSYNFTESSNV